MKKASALSFAIACSLTLMAQNNKVTSARMHLDEFASHGDSTELIAAKQSIDDASVYDKTKDEPKMYLYRGEVYNEFFNIRLSKTVSKLMAKEKGVSPAKITTEAYAQMDTTTICIAANSFIKVLQLDPKSSYADEVKDPSNILTTEVYLENKAYREYGNQHYETSLALAKKIILLFTTLNVSDTSYKRIFELAANSADKAGNTATALGYYQKMIALKYGDAAPYQSLATMYFKQKDTAKAMDYIGKGRAQFPDDLSLIITETNYYITRHNYEKAADNLTLSISKVEQRPDKDKNKKLLASLYTNLGGIYDKRANPRDEKGADLPKPADYDSLFTKAETNYNKALGINPEDFDLLYNIGALYFNRAVPITKKANDLPLSAKAKYDKLMDDAKSYFLKAQPFFERAHKIKPNDAVNNNALMEVYANTNQTDKAEALKSGK